MSRMEKFEVWWLSWSTEPECGLDEFTLDQQAAIVGFCKAAFDAGREVALEEAAKVADQYARIAAAQGHVGEWEAEGLRDVSEDIRARRVKV